MRRVLLLAALMVATLVPAAPRAQVVLNQASVPTCTNGQTLVYNSSTVMWECGTVGTGTTTGTGTTGTVPLWTGTSSLSTSPITFSGSAGSTTGTWSVTQLILRGATSGTLTLLPPGVASTSSIKFPPGVTDFTATGPGVVFQASSGAAFTVVGVTGSGSVVLSASPTLTGVATIAAVVAATADITSAALTGNASGPVQRFMATGANAGNRNWAIINAMDTFGELAFRVSNAKGGDPSTSAGGVTMLTLIPSTGAAVLAGTFSADKFFAATANSAAKINVESPINSTPDLDLYTTQSPAGSGFIRFINAAGSLTGSITHNATTTVAFNTASDARLKRDQGVATSVEALRALVVHDFDWISDGLADRGLFAQEAYYIKPLAVTPGESDELDAAGLPKFPWSVDYSKFVPDLIVGWQRHEARLAAIEAKLNIAVPSTDDAARLATTRQRANDRMTSITTARADARAQAKRDKDARDAALADCQRQNKVIKQQGGATVDCTIKKAA